MKPTTCLRFFRAHVIPVALKDNVKAELDRLTNAGMIRPITSSEWALPLVVVKKPTGKRRLSVDFKATINAQLIIDSYPLLRQEELF